MKTPRRRNAAIQPTAALWASAFVLAGLVVSLSARYAGAQSQIVGTVSSAGELTILRADTGAGDDVILVLDNVADSLFVYGVQNRDTIELIQTYDVSRLFIDARGAAGLPARP
ncbi:MAG: hypothetical protein ACF8QF_10120 [Phycisphaerales bacterium]